MFQTEAGQQQAQYRVLTLEGTELEKDVNGSREIWKGRGILRRLLKYRNRVPSRSSDTVGLQTYIICFLLSSPKCFAKRMRRKLHKGHFEEFFSNFSFPQEAKIGP